MLQAQCTLVDMTNCKACVEAPRPQLAYEHVTVPYIYQRLFPHGEKKRVNHQPIGSTLMMYPEAWSWTGNHVYVNVDDPSCHF